MEDINIIHKKLTTFFNELIQKEIIYDVNSLEYSFVSETISRASEKESFSEKKFGNLKIKISFYICFTEKEYFGERFSSVAYENIDSALEDIKIRINSNIAMKAALENIQNKTKGKKISVIDKLREELKTCLSNENYERADEIKKEIEDKELKSKKPKK